MTKNNPGKTGNNWNKLQVKKRVQKILSLNSIIKLGINDRNNRKITGNNWILIFWKIWKRVQNFPAYVPSFFGGVLTGINGKWQGKSTCEVTDKASYCNYCRNGRRSAILASAKSLFLPPKNDWKIVRLHKTKEKTWLVLVLLKIL